jgi:hypothetical protein
MCLENFLSWRAISGTTSTTTASNGTIWPSDCHSTAMRVPTGSSRDDPLSHVNGGVGSSGVTIGGDVSTGARCGSAGSTRAELGMTVGRILLALG